MKRTVLFMAAFCFFCVQANAGERLGIGLRAGPSFYTQDVFGGTSDAFGPLKVGPIVSGNIIYEISKSISVGLNVEWETHELQSHGREIGDADAVSLIPFVEYDFLAKDFIGKGGDLFYAFLGLGYNINSFSPEGEGKEKAEALGVDYDVDVDNTFAVKAGVGMESYFTDDLAFNLEVGWKYNKGDADEIVDGNKVMSGDFNGSGVTVLLGLRYYFHL